jgi:hypothetical protein
MLLYEKSVSSGYGYEESFQVLFQWLLELTELTYYGKLFMHLPHSHRYGTPEVSTFN